MEGVAMLFVSDIKENYDAYRLPLQFAECLPEDCPTCGSPMELSESLTGLHCSNPRCPDKLVMRIKAICQDIGVLNFGESTIEKFLNYYEVSNPLNIFALKKGMLVSDEISEAVSDNIISQIEEKKNFLLWEYVRVANIPGVQTSAREIFQGYSNLTEAYKDIEAGGVAFIQEKLGISNDNEVSIRAMKVYNSLMEFKDDLLECECEVNIINMEGKRELNVVCSDQVGDGFSKKAEFYAYINETFKDKVHVNFLPSVNKKIDYLVWAGADGSPARYTSKVKTVEGYQEKGLNIPIVTAQQFIEEMQKL